MGKIDNFYGESKIEKRCIIDRLLYKGRGRPRKTDYMNLQEANKRINTYFNQLIEGRRIHDPSKTNL